MVVGHFQQKRQWWVLVSHILLKESNRQGDGLFPKRFYHPTYQGNETIDQSLSDKISCNITHFIRMSFLSTLLEDISDSCEMQRGESLGTRNRYLFDSAYEQVGCQQATSRSLSHKKKSKKESMESLQIKVKSCLKILHVMNKKFRTIKYFVFVKLEDLKNQRKPPPLGKQQQVFKAPSNEKIELMKQQPHKPAGESTNSRGSNKIKQTINAIYQKYYSHSLKQSAFHRLKENSNRIKDSLHKLSSFIRFMQNKRKQHFSCFINAAKNLNKRIEQLQLFESMMKSSLRKIGAKVKKESFEKLLERSWEQQQGSVESPEPVMMERNFSSLLQSPFDSIPSTRKAEEKPIMDRLFQQKYGNISFDSVDSHGTTPASFTPCKPFCFESLSHSPTISYQLQQRSYSFKGKSIEHVPVQLNKLYKDNIVFEVHDVGQNKLFSANEFSISPQNSFVKTAPSVKTFHTGKKQDYEDSKIWGKMDDLFPSHKTQPLFDKERSKQKSFFVSQLERRPTSNITSSLGNNRKLNLTYNPESERDSFYSTSEMLKLAEHHTSRDKSTTPKTSMPNSPYLNYIQSDDFKYRHTLKNASFSGQVKKIAQIPKFRLPCDKSRYT